MHASDVWIDKWRSSSHKYALCVVNPLSSKDAVVVADFHRFTDCHLEAILDMNNVATSAVNFYTVDGEDVCLTTGVSSPNQVQHDILPHRHSQLSDLTTRLYTTTSLKSISLQRWLYHQMFKLSSDQFNSQADNHLISHSSFWLVNRLTADEYRCYDRKYVNIRRH